MSDYAKTTAELKFENEIIQKLTKGFVGGDYVTDEKGNSVLNEGTEKYLKNRKLWKYEKNIKTTDDLWNNFKKILEELNKGVIEKNLGRTTLTEAEFNQVKVIISSLSSPYEAGRFLYGVNGTTQVEIDSDDGKHLMLKVFDQSEVGAGDTRYQVVNQIERPAKIPGKNNRRFDVTLLINGLPMIQIEAKKGTVSVNDALNQMHQYIKERQYTDIFSTLQILVAMAPNNIRYMANTTDELFNKNFAFKWQGRDNEVVRDWKIFAEQMLSIPMAHNMATNYMILDGTKNKQMIKVMRPYQVYATQEVINEVKKVNFEDGSKKVGYVWHTTGSGKTITSFKTAWLASRLPNIDKVVFVVDRISLVNQTNESYRAYDPDSTDDMSGNVIDAENTSDLMRKLRSKDKKHIIVTSFQKLNKLVKRVNFKDPGKKLLFIVDEAHRSTGGEGFELIQKKFKTAAWVGYTGTPMFDVKDNKLTTEEIFGPLLSCYTIREAIADKNVLGFMVDFQTTIDQEEMKNTYLPEFFKSQNPRWTDGQVREKIENLTQEDMDDEVSPSFYDKNQKHVELVVQDIFNNWKNRSNEGRYNAMLTTRVGGGKSSTPMAMMYFDEFKKENEKRREKGEPTLKVGITFSKMTDNSDNMVDMNDALHRAMIEYNKEFGTSFGLDTDKEYTQDLMTRINKTAADGKYLDLVIVVDQLLTGFDAPKLNTLYVDRTLRGANLIQAYSRTNRISDIQTKPFGRIVNYRWPANNEKLMDAALKIYANVDSAKKTKEKENIEEKEILIDLGVLQKSFDQQMRETREIVENLREMTDNFKDLPPSEARKEEMFELLKQYNSQVEKLKQYTNIDANGCEIEGYDYDNPDELISHLGMEPDEEVMLKTVLTNELKDFIAQKRKVPVMMIDLKMTHIKDVEINYDYLTELIEELLNLVHDEQTDLIEKTREKIRKFAFGLDDRNYADKIITTADMIVDKMYPDESSKISYPYKIYSVQDIVEDATVASVDRMLVKFRYRWGITEIISNSELRALFENHNYKNIEDLNKRGEISNIKKAGKKVYKTMAADEEVVNMPSIKYGNRLSDAIYELADMYVQMV